MNKEQNDCFKMLKAVQTDLNSVVVYNFSGEASCIFKSFITQLHPNSGY